MISIDDYDYTLPHHLIAHRPKAERTQSRLLVLPADGRKMIHDAIFYQLLDYVKPGDVIVGNDTKVIKARLYTNKETGGKVEVLVDRLLDKNHFVAFLRSNRKVNVGVKLYLDDIEFTVQAKDGMQFVINFPTDLDINFLFEKYGEIPLPHYIERDQPDVEDEERYQTVYAKSPGAIAAPTAGLHFDDSLLQLVHDKGVAWTTVTLHVGAGTFQPIRVNDVANHVMHKESFLVSDLCCSCISEAKKRGGRVIAVGTTVVRALESSVRNGALQPTTGDTDLFIKPGFNFQVVDGLVTNFHLPKSTLLMLVCTFGGYSRVMESYYYAVKNGYRFFSYGDAMFLERSDGI